METDNDYAEEVSIQLVSPASGEVENREEKSLISAVSIQLVSPASGENFGQTKWQATCIGVSIQLVSPASGENN